MTHLSGLVQQPVHRRLARHVPALVGQAGHDLTGRQVLEFLAVQDAQGSLALGVAELVGRAAVNTLVSAAPVADLQRIHPTLQGAIGHADHGAGAVASQAC